ncbi:MAG: saccharopine dehydrogenase C-terminal domain-containing protein [Thermoprotei archaeon]
MKALILGSGNVGTLVAYDLSRDFEVWVVDKDEAKLGRVKKVAEVLKLDLSRTEILDEIFRGFEVIVNTLPGFLGFRILKKAVDLGRDLVDVSFMPEDPLVLSNEAKQRGARIVVDAGFAPGLSNVLVGHIYSKLGTLDEGVINVGGLPKEPKPPLYHQVLFSPQDLIDEYLRPARCIIDGKLTVRDPLEIIEEIRIKNFTFERFPTDGLRTLLSTIKARNLIEYTLRWPGHLARMKLLKELGFFRSEFIEPTMKLIIHAMTYETPDFSIMEVYGRSNEKEIRFFMYDEYSEGFSSMSRVTGYMAALITRLVLKSYVDPGINPPEYLGMNDKTFRFVVDEVLKKNIVLETC